MAQNEDESPFGNVPLLRPYRRQKDDDTLRRGALAASKQSSDLGRVSEDKAPKRMSFSLDHQINIDQLRELKKIFHGEGGSGPGELTEAEFIEAFGPILGNMGDLEIRQLFHRIDANANGVIDWDEFSTYVLLSGEQKNHDDAAKALYLPPGEAADRSHGLPSGLPPGHHNGMVTRLLVHRNGMYYTCSKDGTVRVWNSETQSHMQTIPCCKGWINDGVFLKGGTKLAVCGMDRTLTTFNITQSGAELHRAFVGNKRGWKKEKRSYVVDEPDKREQRTAGTSQESSLEKFLSRVANTARKRRYVEMMTLEDLVECPMAIAEWSGLICLGLKGGGVQVYDPSRTYDGDVVPCLETCHVHSTTISRLRTSGYLDAVLSAGWDGTVKVLSLSKGKVLRELSDATPKSIFAMEWSEKHRLLATAGTERHVSVWNPYISRPVYRLDGHMCPLIEVCFNDTTDHLISVGLDKSLRVWDIRTMRCVQSFSETRPHWPEDLLSAVAIDETRRSLVCCSSFPTIFPMLSAVSRFPPEPKYMGHHNPVVSIAYNSDFEQVISADRNRVLVWDIRRGARLVAFLPEVGGSTVVEDGVVGMQLDSNGRRLILATRTILQAYNYANGQPLKIYNFAENKLPDITCVAYCGVRDGNRQVVCSAASRVFVWLDSNNTLPERVFHSCDISAYLGESVTVTALCSISSTSIAIGTSRGVIILYAHIRNEIESTLGTPSGTSVAQLEMCHVKAVPSTVLASLSATDPHITVWSLKLKVALFVVKYTAADRQLTTFSIHDDGNYIAGGDDSGYLVTWKVDPDAYRVPDNTPASSPHVTMVMNFIAHPGRHLVCVKMFVVGKRIHILTAADDSQLHLFNCEGRFIGVCGQQVPWDIDNPCTWGHHPDPEMWQQQQQLNEQRKRINQPLNRGWTDEDDASSLGDAVTTQGRGGSRRVLPKARSTRAMMAAQSSSDTDEPSKEGNEVVKALTVAPVVPLKPRVDQSGRAKRVMTSARLRFHKSNWRSCLVQGTPSPRPCGQEPEGREGHQPGSPESLSEAPHNAESGAQDAATHPPFVPTPPRTQESPLRGALREVRMADAASDEELRTKETLQRILHTKAARPVDWTFRATTKLKCSRVTEVSPPRLRQIDMYHRGSSTTNKDVNQS
eukprot:Sspe_Gene.12869::Locus_4412_Transcript_1_1_Confidence_1.000_Length_3569::g.12869::m.12869